MQFAAGAFSQSEDSFFIPRYDTGLGNGPAFNPYYFPSEYVESRSYFPGPVHYETGADNTAAHEEETPFVREDPVELFETKKNFENHPVHDPLPLAGTVAKETDTSEPSAQLVSSSLSSANFPTNQAILRSITNGANTGGSTNSGELGSLMPGLLNGGSDHTTVWNGTSSGGLGSNLQNILTGSNSGGFGSVVPGLLNGANSGGLGPNLQSILTGSNSGGLGSVVPGLLNGGSDLGGLATNLLSNTGLVQGLLGGVLGIVQDLLGNLLNALGQLLSSLVTDIVLVLVKLIKGLLTGTLNGLVDKVLSTLLGGETTDIMTKNIISQVHAALKKLPGGGCNPRSYGMGRNGPFNWGSIEI